MKLLVVSCLLTAAITLAFIEGPDSARFSKMKNGLRGQTNSVILKFSPTEFRNCVNATESFLDFRKAIFTELGSDSIRSICASLLNAENLIYIDRMHSGNVLSYQSIYVVRDSIDTKLIRYHKSGAAEPYFDTVSLINQLNIDSIFSLSDSLSYSDILTNNYSIFTVAKKDSVRVKLYRNSRFNDWFRQN